MTLRLVLALLLTSVFALPACGPQPAGKVPVDSELKPWEAPEEDDLVGEDADEDEDEGDDEEEGGEDEAPADEAEADAAG